MKFWICITMLYVSLIWCLQFGYVHLDMHIFSRFMVFKLLDQQSAFRVSKLPLSLHPLSHGLFVTLKFCGSGAKSFSALNINFLCVFENLRFDVWRLSFRCLRLEHLTFEVWALNLNVWGFRFESKCLKFEVWMLKVWTFKVWNVSFKSKCLRFEV
jgi:hypothetical protein